MTPDKWQGVYTFPVTTMNETGDVLDLGAYRDQIDFIISGGMHGITLMGSIGEFAYLEPSERQQIVETAVDAANGRVPVISGVSAITTKAAVRYTKEAAATGADGVLVALQSYFSLSADEIVDHFAAIADASDLPIFIYNNVGTTGHDLDVPILERLLEMPSILGIKESTGRLERTMELQRVFGDRLEIFVGWEPLAFSMFQLRVRAWSCGIGNFVPNLCVELYDAAVRDKDFDRALKIHERVAPLSDFILRHRLAACVKPGLEMMGRKAGAPRLPVRPIGPELQMEMRQLLADVGAL